MLKGPAVATDGLLAEVKLWLDLGEAAAQLLDAKTFARMCNEPQGVKNPSQNHVPLLGSLGCLISVRISHNYQIPNRPK